MKENGMMLSRLSVSAKTLITLFLAAMILNHLFAVLLTYYLTHSAFQSAAEYFHFTDVRKLLRMSHQHMFGHGTMYFIVGALFCLTSVKESWKRVVIPLPFAGAALDLMSWWLIKFKGEKWEILSMLGGSLLSLGFAVMVLGVLYELWLKTDQSG